MYRHSRSLRLAHQVLGCRPIISESSRTLVVSRNGPPAITVKEARKQLKTLVGSAESFSAQRDESVIKLKLAASQAELPKRCMKDSYCEASIPLGTDKKLREKYVNFHNTVRFGRILEDLDTTAVWISYTHNMDPSKPADQKSPLSIVTAAVDRIDMKDNILVPDRDICVRGHVSYVGSTSMEVTMKVEQDHDGGTNEVMVAKFVMVARDPLNVSKAYVNPLEITSAEEEALHKEGEENKKGRHTMAKMSLLSNSPNQEETNLIHDLFLATIDKKYSINTSGTGIAILPPAKRTKLKYRICCENCAKESHIGQKNNDKDGVALWSATFKSPVKASDAVWMENSLLKNLIICFPEKRNLYNKIFGGFLMRKAFEMGWATACVYSKQRPFAIAIDDILFRRPVPIGSLLYFSSQVVYTSGTYMQVKVHLEVVNPKTGEHETTNTMHITFDTTEAVPPVMPKSYAEYMIYIDGVRHFNESIRHQTNM